MIADLEPYAEYKESGSRWLGAVPAHWEVRNLRTLIKTRNERNQPSLPLLSVAREKGVFVRSLTNDDENHNVIPEDLSNYKVARAGNLVINKMKAWQGSMGIAPCDGIVSPAYFVFNFRIANHAYGQALLRSKPYVAHFGQASDGVRVGQWDLTIPGMRQIPVLVPSPDEQAAIVRFLDYANRRLERAIRAKRKVIALLNEQKQAIIHRAVTRGLDPNVPLKPSGIPWLGESPSHWTWTPIKRLLSHMDYGTSEASKAEGRIRILTMGNIQNGEVILPKSGGLDEVPENLLLEHNDLLFTRTNGNPDLVGKVGIFRGQISDKVSFASYLVRLRIRPPHNPQWLHMVLNSAAFWPFARSHALVNLQTNLNSTRYGQFSVPVPPSEEQVQIVEWVGNESSPVSVAVNRTEREIALLREYRTRLIADVVTGKLDVREAARHLPIETDESDPSEPSDDLNDEAALENELPED
jgi:type I restriction enzyme S subunit